MPRYFIVGSVFDKKYLGGIYPLKINYHWNDKYLQIFDNPVFCQSVKSTNFSWYERPTDHKELMKEDLMSKLVNLKEIRYDITFRQNDEWNIKLPTNLPRLESLDILLRKYDEDVYEDVYADCQKIFQGLDKCGPRGWENIRKLFFYGYMEYRHIDLIPVYFRNVKSLAFQSVTLNEQTLVEILPQMVLKTLKLIRVNLSNESENIDRIISTFCQSKTLKNVEIENGTYSTSRLIDSLNSNHSIKSFILDGSRDVDPLHSPQNLTITNQTLESLFIPFYEDDVSNIPLESQWQSVSSITEFNLRSQHLPKAEYLLKYHPKCTSISYRSTTLEFVNMTEFIKSNNPNVHTLALDYINRNSLLPNEYIQSLTMNNFISILHLHETRFKDFIFLMDRMKSLTKLYVSHVYQWDIVEFQRSMIEAKNLKFLNLNSIVFPKEGVELSDDYDDGDIDDDDDDCKHRESTSQFLKSLCKIIDANQNLSFLRIPARDGDQLPVEDLELFQQTIERNYQHLKYIYIWNPSISNILYKYMIAHSQYYNQSDGIF
ncbi:hypothetical protein DLAC_05481 [Tieghemostelium lacteum]|uniref:Uncharacterized protein n=1 Tax=Tieghemostelium lacteum TaxID=361077 RepID=A0A151ZG91_TIELA|nr:hypothetical protein DLAC_05481 [Tieghemostelium lacteum]|eukprot:KYQ92890.1 hypothetical protein DLAC_05481 [Tieghemostelium lacteum]